MKWEAIILHHSLTTDQATLDWQGVRRFHTSWAYQGNIISEAEGRRLKSEGKTVKKPWSDIGYQIGIERVRGQLEALLGRPLDRGGAHTSQEGMNRKAIGVMLCGNFDHDPPDEEMLRFTVKRAIIPFMKMCGIGIDKIYPHRRFATYKSCPGSNSPWMDFLGMIQESLE